MAGAISALAAAAAVAQPYPTKPVRVIVPFAPGGSTDVIARVVGQKMADSLGQPLIIDNRPGAASSLGTEAAARAAPDGYTLVMGTPGLTINPSLYANAGFQPVRDFNAITLLASVPLVIAVHPSLAANDVRELVALAKSRPGELSYASNGSSTHLTAELFSQRAGVTLVHVPYKGSAPATSDLLAGHVQLGFDNILSALPHMKTGKLRALAVTSAERARSAPQVPTLAESGFPGFDASSWFGLLAPAGTPREIVNRLHDAVLAALQAAEVRDKLAGIGADIIGAGPERFAAFVAAEHERWAKLIRERNIKGSGA